MKQYLNLKAGEIFGFNKEQLSKIAISEELVRLVLREKTNNRRECRYMEDLDSSWFEQLMKEIECLKDEISRANQEKDWWQRKVAELEEELRSVERSWQQAEIAYKARAHCLKEECDKLREELEMISAKLAGELKENERLKSSIVHCINESGVFREQSGVQRQVVYAEYNTFEPGAVQIKGSVLPSARFAPSVQDGGRKEAAL